MVVLRRTFINLIYIIIESHNGDDATKEMKVVYCAVKTQSLSEQIYASSISGITDQHAYDLLTYSTFIYNADIVLVFFM
jgi:hypothetical protein